MSGKRPRVGEWRTEGHKNSRAYNTWEGRGAQELSSVQRLGDVEYGANSQIQAPLELSVLPLLRLVDTPHQPLCGCTAESLRACHPPLLVGRYSPSLRLQCCNPDILRAPHAPHAPPHAPHAPPHASPHAPRAPPHTPHAPPHSPPCAPPHASRAHPHASRAHPHASRAHPHASHTPLSSHPLLYINSQALYARELMPLRPSKHPLPLTTLKRASFLPDLRRFGPIFKGWGAHSTVGVECRQVWILVEHGFGLVLQDWPYLNAFWMWGMVLGRVLLTNAHSCMGACHPHFT